MNLAILKMALKTASDPEKVEICKLMIDTMNKETKSEVYDYLKGLVS